MKERPELMIVFFEALYMRRVFENIKEVKQDRCYTVQSGFADVMSLKPGENSAFKISLFGLSSSDTIDHYTLLACGTASP